MWTSGNNYIIIFEQIFNSKTIGLYRDDRLSSFRNSGQQPYNQTFFKDKDLHIIIKCNLRMADYLDVTLNLNDGTYHPFHKPNN